MTSRWHHDGAAGAETAVVRTARMHGFPDADRHPLRGRLDVYLCPGVVLEVRAGERARVATDLDIVRWLDELARERDDARAQAALLVVQRRGVGARNAARWWAWWRLGWIADLTGTSVPGDARLALAPVRCLYVDALMLLRATGRGAP